MFSFRTNAIIFLVIFNIFYIGVGFYRFLFSKSQIGEEDESLISLYNVRIVLCFLTGISGFVIFFAKNKLFKILYLIFLVIGMSLSCYKIFGTQNFSNNTELRNKLLDVIKNNETDTSFGILLVFYQTTKSCCGISGPNDYLNSSILYDYASGDFVLPKSCCKMSDGFVNENELEPCLLKNAHPIGCWRFMYETNRESESGSFKLNLIVLSAQCIAAVLTLTLFKKEDIYY